MYMLDTHELNTVAPAIIVFPPSFSSSSTAANTRNLVCGFWRWLVVKLSFLSVVWETDNGRTGVGSILHNQKTDVVVVQIQIQKANLLKWYSPPVLPLCFSGYCYLFKVKTREKIANCHFGFWKTKQAASVFCSLF